ncbi:type-2 angiotensin II receptor-like [Amblyraja radiata]|uniref:type-2 angiotensin II receptor-like n=1 Tax=Amblyraja radiata TaxID=386614 RepID=UPI00140274AE|nr:type-2 angiotensin II receptor-like [Amblyraja radiata]
MLDICNQICTDIQNHFNKPISSAGSTRREPFPAETLKMDPLLSSSSPVNTTGIVDVSFSEFAPSLLRKVSDESCRFIVSSRFISNFIPIIYSIIFILGFIANSVVIATFCHRIHLKTVTNIYIINLSIVELLLLSTLPLWAVYYATGYNWLFGAVMCKICSSLVSLNLYARAFFIMSMSINCYLVHLHPIDSQTKRALCQAHCIMILVWTVALVATFPTVYFQGSLYIQSLDKTRCTMVYPASNAGHWSAALSLMENILGFFIPFTVIGICCGSFACHLMRMEVSDRNTCKRNKMLWMVIAVVLAFLICWLPFHVLTFMSAMWKLNFFTDCQMVTIIGIAMPVSICLGFANSCVNPFIYCLVGDQFQTQLTDMARRGSINLYNRRSSATRSTATSCKNSDTTDIGPNHS